MKIFEIFAMMLLWICCSRSESICHFCQCHAEIETISCSTFRAFRSLSNGTAYPEVDQETYSYLQLKFCFDTEKLAENYPNLTVVVEHEVICRQLGVR